MSRLLSPGHLVVAQTTRAKCQIGAHENRSKSADITVRDLLKSVECTPKNETEKKRTVSRLGDWKMDQKKTQLSADEKLAVLKRMDAGENVSDLARDNSD